MYSYPKRDEGEDCNSYQEENWIRDIKVKVSSPAFGDKVRTCFAYYFLHWWNRWVWIEEGFPCTICRICFLRSYPPVRHRLHYRPVCTRAVPVCARQQHRVGRVAADKIEEGFP